MIRRYTHYDYPMISSWYVERGMNVPPEASLPTRGYICDELIAGFIYQTDSNLAIIEAIISDPSAPEWRRKSSLLKLAEHLTDTCHEMGFENILAVGVHPSVAAICEELGYHESIMKVWTLAAPMQS